MIDLSVITPKLLAEALKALRTSSTLFGGLRLRLDTTADKGEDNVRRMRRALILSMAETVALHEQEPRVGDPQSTHETTYQGYSRQRWGSETHGSFIKFPVNKGFAVRITNVSIGAGGVIVAVLACDTALNVNDYCEVQARIDP